MQAPADKAGLADDEAAGTQAMYEAAGLSLLSRRQSSLTCFSLNESVSFTFLPLTGLVLLILAMAED